jgi:hypothetical protein
MGARPPRRARRLALALCASAPALVGWGGAGEASGALVSSPGKGEAPVHQPFRADAVGRFDADGLRLILTITLPGAADAVLDLSVPRPIADGGAAALPQRGVAVLYQEFGASGASRFRAHETAGAITVDRRWSDRIEVWLDAELEDAGAARTVSDLHVVLGAVGTEAGAAPTGTGSSGGGVAVAAAPSHGGCDDWGDDSPHAGGGAASDDGGGCEGDDWDSDDGGWAGSADGAGCEGDAVDGGDDGWGSSDDGGCEGDDWDSDSSDSSDSSDGPDCEGDAIAAPGDGAPPRSPWPARVVRWLPWLWVWLAVRLLRRRSGVAVYRSAA